MNRTRKTGGGTSFTIARTWWVGMEFISLLLLVRPAMVLGVEPLKEPIRVGVSWVQSSSSKEFGLRLLKGSMAYFDQVNRQGGIHGRPIKVILKDDGYELEQAVQNTSELIKKGDVFFLFGYVGTPILTRTLPLLKYFEDQHIVNIAPFTGADLQRRPPYDRFVFNIRASYRDETKCLVDYFVFKGHRKIGFLGQADAYGKSGEEGVSAALKAHGLEIAGLASYRRDSPFETNMRRQVEILRRSGATVVIAFGVYAPCGAFIRDARLAGWDVPIANVSFVGPSALLTLLNRASPKYQKDLTKDLFNSLVVPIPWDPKVPLGAEYGKAVGEEGETFIGFEGWLNAAVVVEALRRAGPHADRKDFIEAMESLGGWDPGIGHELGFSKTCHQGLAKVWLARTSRGQWIPETVPKEAEIAAREKSAEGVSLRQKDAERSKGKVK